MSYDLALRRQITGSIARGDARPTDSGVTTKSGLVLPTSLVLAAAAAGAGLMLALGGHRKVRKKVEKTYYRATWRDLDQTQEMPAVSMREMVYGPGADQ